MAARYPEPGPDEPDNRVGTSLPTPVAAKLAAGQVAEALRAGRGVLTYTDPPWLAEVGSGNDDLVRPVQLDEADAQLARLLIRPDGRIAVADAYRAAPQRISSAIAS